MLRFRNFPVPKKFMDKSGEGYQEFPSKFCCLKVAKTFVGEPLCDVFQKNSGSKMFMEEMGISGVSFECFFSHSAKTFRRGNL